MKWSPLILLFLVLYVSCKSKGTHNSIGNFITRPCAIIIRPSKRMIDKMQKESSEEDYATVLDDNVFYMSESEHYLDSLKVTKIEMESEGSVKFKTQAGKTYKMSLSKFYFGIILFNGKDKPIEADMTGIALDYDKYMKSSAN